MRFLILQTSFFLVLGSAIGYIGAEEGFQALADEVFSPISSEEITDIKGCVVIKIEETPVLKELLALALRERDGKEWDLNKAKIKPVDRDPAAKPLTGADLQKILAEHGPGAAVTGAGVQGWRLNGAGIDPKRLDKVLQELVHIQNEKMRGRVAESIQKSIRGNGFRMVSVAGMLGGLYMMLQDTAEAAKDNDHW